MYWANFLHIYQPPTQKKYWVKRVADESYRKIFTGLKANPKAKLTLNINGVLLELLDACGYGDVIKDISDLIKRGQIELTGSAKYHALLPFLPETEIIRQVKLNEQTLKKYFGNKIKLRGFFPPEMAFDPKLVPVLAKLGYEWIIADELSFPRNTEMNHERIYMIAGIKPMKIFFRERRMSWIILSGQIGTGNLLVQSLEERLKQNEYLLTAMDGETFGHHRPGLENLLFEIYRSQDLETVKISDLIQLFPKTEMIKPVASTWALMEKDLEQNKPFSRWFDKQNSIHTAQWKLTNLAINIIETSENNKKYKKARAILDEALHSDQYWWASARPWWSIEMIERGAKQLKDCLFFLAPENAKIKKAQIEAQKLYEKIIFTAFQWQRSGMVDTLAHQEDEDVRQRTDVGLPKLPTKEVQKMIARLDLEMRSVAGREEFERAAQIRDRIAELKRYISGNSKPKTTKEGDKEFDLRA